MNGVEGRRILVYGNDCKGLGEKAGARFIYRDIAECVSSDGMADKYGLQANFEVLGVDNKRYWAQVVILFNGAGATPYGVVVFQVVKDGVNTQMGNIDEQDFPDPGAGGRDVAVAILDLVNGEASVRLIKDGMTTKQYSVKIPDFLIGGNILTVEAIPTGYGLQIATFSKAEFTIFVLAEPLVMENYLVVPQGGQYGNPLLPCTTDEIADVTSEDSNLNFNVSGNPVMNVSYGATVEVVPTQPRVIE